MADDHVPVALALEVAAQVVACPYCKAPRGEPCKTPGGRLAPLHNARYEAAKGYVRERRRLDAWNDAVRRG